MIDTSQLRTTGCVYLQYPPELRNAVSVAMEGWRRFCALPNETKLKFPYEQFPDGKTVSGIGYELKLEAGNTLDRKEDFQLRARMRDVLMDRANAFGDPAAAAFVDDALRLSSMIKPLLVEFAESLEQEFGMVGFADDVRSTETDLLLRFLHYFGDCELGDTLASPHVDKSSFTLHLYESDAGVERLDRAGMWIPIPLSHDQTIVFPSLGLQNRTMNQAKALCHRVVATEESARDGRYSAVCFVVPWNSPAYDKERHGRLQDKPPGFNYELPWNEFHDLFKT